VCGKDISGLSEDDRQKHTNACLDGLSTTATTSPTAASQRIEDTQRPAIEVANEYRCDICGRDLSALEVHDRVKHLTTHKREPGAREKVQAERQKKKTAQQQKAREEEGKP
jgi:hypothetical protein